ncbi:winged helix-turn-helix domain-containing protein [Aquincola sp. S2]|uniref:Winged helix-turn-helix domain-containing protein n=1 Tax=Pseudaquabacterium terrae TaxID=2732868 RepID=A0ABX2EF82_9BURK|nr:winged helix-turn-helix domain-containing protein [Aquabacterium terrae]NRF67278.1 winged helix-turn-helix domain-containing protein [Aquabacterium terrae]
MPEQAGACVYRFAQFELQPAERRLLIGGEPAVLAPRAFDVLLALVERANHLVTKDELYERVWPRLVVEDNNLQQQIAALRRLLGADAISTVTGRGYRFELQPQRLAERPAPTSGPSRLPLQLTSFIGREREIAEAARLLGSSRLLTLVGMGGIGKTRLSLRLAADAVDAGPEGACFVDLAPLRDPSLVANQVGQALGVQEEAGRPVLGTLCAHLQARSLLIVLDNCEHLIGACASLCDALLRAAPGLRIVATSREPLRVPGEQLYALLPMGVEPGVGTDALEPGDAVRLFIDRARLHKPDFVPGAREMPLLTELCARLEGIPLALELAAARMRTLSIADINHRLRDRFKLLTDGGRVLVERQRTMRALLDWSYELLPPDERVLCERLSVFAGGFDLAAAEGVCGDAPLAREGIVDLLSSLVDKSLVLAGQAAQGSQWRDHTRDPTRYRMLETMRDYARDKLAARAEGEREVEATAQRHCHHFLAVAKAANQGIRGPQQGAWTERVELELDNLRGAIAFALAGGVDPIIAVKFEVALLKFRLLRGHVGEGRKVIHAALELPAVRAADVAHAHALYVAAGLAANQGECTEAARLLQACLALRRGFGNPVETAATLSTLALVRLQEGDAVLAREGEEAALAIFREIGDRIGEAIGLLHLGQIEMFVDDDRLAQDRFEAGLAIAREIDHAEVRSECERMLGELALDRGDVAGARLRFAASLAVCRDAADKRNEAISLCCLARTDLADGDTAQARGKLEAAMCAFRGFDMKHEMVGCIEDFAALAQASGDTWHAVRLYATASAARERLTLTRTPRAERRLRGALALAASTLGEADFQDAMLQGRGARLDDGVRQALEAVTGVRPGRGAT